MNKEQQKYILSRLQELEREKCEQVRTLAGQNGTKGMDPELRLIREKLDKEIKKSHDRKYAAMLKFVNYGLKSKLFAFRNGYTPELMTDRLLSAGYPFEFSESREYLELKRREAEFREYFDERINQVRRRVKSVTDEIMLGDAQEALTKLRDFEKEKI